MSPHQAELDWEFLADEELEAPWPPAPSGPLGSSDQGACGRIRLALLFGLAIVVLAAAGIGGAHARRQALEGVAEVEEGVHAAVHADQWVREHAPELSAEMLVDSDASDYVEWMVLKERKVLAANSRVESPSAMLEIGDTSFAGNSAAAELTLTVPGAQGAAGAVYRQTRFYRETPEGWLRTKPDLRLWGPTRVVETDHLVWRYRRRDEAIVLEIAEASDALYAQLMQDYGVTGAEDGSKLTVDVCADCLPGSLSLREESEARLVVPSPFVCLVPESISHAEILEQAVALELLASVAAQAQNQHDIRRSEALLSGIELWQLQEMDLPLSRWPRLAMRWSCGGARVEEGNVALHESEFYSELCADHSIWMIRPNSIYTPVHCEGRSLGPSVDSAGWKSIRGMTSDPPALELEGAVGYRTTWAIQSGYLLKAYTVVDYAVSAYGRESLPELVAALGEHGYWTELMPAVYGVSLYEFSLGWQEHVAKMVE